MDSLRARALAYRRSALYDGATVTSHARAAYRASFAEGHGCSLCGPPIAIPADLPAAERNRRAVALRKAHFTNLASVASRARRKVAGDAA